MSPAPPPTDPRREHLRRQAVARRQGVLDRLAATRSIVIGVVVATTCVLAGYLDASAHTQTSTSSTAGVGSAYGDDSSSYDSPDTSAQNQFGGSSAPSASSGSGTVVSGGS